MAMKENLSHPAVSQRKQKTPLAFSLEENIFVMLSERDAEVVLEAFHNPPPVNEKLRQAAERFNRKYGR